VGNAMLAAGAKRILSIQYPLLHLGRRKKIICYLKNQEKQRQNSSTGHCQKNDVCAAYPGCRR